MNGETVFSIFNKTKRSGENPCNTWFARFPAANVVWIFHRTRVTPNQITVLSLLVGWLACFWMAYDLSHTGLIISVLLLHLAYVVDCADGQLARLRGLQGPLGEKFDFLVDAGKGVTLMAAVGLRLYWQGDSHLFAPVTLQPIHHLYWGLAGAAILGFSSLCTRMLRDDLPSAPAEASAKAGACDTQSSCCPFTSPGALAMRVGKFIHHYPGYIVFLGIFDKLEWFLPPYVFFTALYMLKSFAQISIRIDKR